MVKRVAVYTGKKQVGSEIKEGRTCYKVVKGKKRVKCTGQRSAKGMAKRKRLLKKAKGRTLKRGKKVIYVKGPKKMHWAKRVKQYRQQNGGTVAQAKKALGIGKK